MYTFRNLLIINEFLRGGVKSMLAPVVARWRVFQRIIVLPFFLRIKLLLSSKPGVNIIIFFEYSILLHFIFPLYHIVEHISCVQGHMNANFNCTPNSVATPNRPTRKAG
jgi:hypothetical protein